MIIANGDNCRVDDGKNTKHENIKVESLTKHHILLKPFPVG